MKLGSKVEALRDITVIESDLTVRTAVLKGSMGEIIGANVLPSGELVLNAKFVVEGKTEAIILFDEPVLGLSIKDYLNEVEV